MLGFSDDFGIVVDTVLHAGSFLAILIYFWKEWVYWAQSYRQPDKVEHASFYRKLPLFLLLATIPIILFGPVIERTVLESTRNSKTVGVVMLMAAMWFLFCEFRKTEKGRFGYAVALVMGIAQVFAILPGASRSGLTTGAGMLAGQKRTDAARFSFFMALPAIGGAIVYQMKDILTCSTSGIAPHILFIGFITCFAVSIACIHLCLAFFRRHGLYAFAAYLMIIGLLLVIRA